MKRGGLAVLGTDTGVGKTVVTAALALAFRRIGVRAAVFKPVATGGVRTREGLISRDVLWLIRTLNIKESPRSINPLCYRLPLAPWVAAEEERGPAYSPAAVQKAYERLRRRNRLVLVEGVGGVLVPLSSREYVADLCARLGLKALLVARAGLGTINHTLLSIAALRSRGVRPAAVILNRARGKDVSEKTNARTIERLSGVAVLATLPAIRELKGASGGLRRLARMLPVRRLACMV